MRWFNPRFTGLIVLLSLWISPLAPQVSAANLAPNDDGVAEFIRTHPNFRGFVTPQPPYPAASRYYHEQGVVVVKVTFAKEGQVSAVKVVKSSGHWRLDDNTVNYVKARWRSTFGKEKALTVPLRYQFR